MQHMESHELAGAVKKMKRKTAKEILTASFQELAAVKSIDKITIQEIVDNCGYSPATFYRYFTDKYDLIAWEHTRAVGDIVDQTSADDYLWKQTLYDGARFLCMPVQRKWYGSIGSRWRNSN